LRNAYGNPDPPYVIDPFELILFENVAYLVDDERRVHAFETLRRVIGLRPDEILNASPEQFGPVAELAGSNKQGQIEKLIRSAEIVQREFNADLSRVLKSPLKQAIAAIKKFPSIGEPSAEKILLFTGTAAVLALESNGLRVLVRIGYAQEQKNYTAMYRAAQKAVADQVPKEIDRLVAAHLLLRKHGQQVCKRTKPLCAECVIRPMCDYGSGRA
jgi:endonuclease III